MRRAAAERTIAELTAKEDGMERQLRETTLRFEALVESKQQEGQQQH